MLIQKYQEHKLQDEIVWYPSTMPFEISTIQIRIIPSQDAAATWKDSQKPFEEVIQLFLFLFINYFPFTLHPGIYLFYTPTADSPLSSPSVPSPPPPNIHSSFVSVTQLSLINKSESGKQFWNFVSILISGESLLWIPTSLPSKAEYSEYYLRGQEECILILCITREE